MTALVVILALVTLGALALAWTQRRAARAAREERDRAILARESFFDLATHELRSPLAAILGYQELIQDGAYGDTDAAATEPLQRIGRSAHHLLHLIEGVVELSRIRGGALRPDLEPVNLAHVLPQAADAFRARSEERRLRPIVRLPESLPTISTDLERLQRALDLLITSAVKHPAGDTLEMDISLPDGELVIGIRGTAIEMQDDQDPALRLGIRIGIADGIARLLGGALELGYAEDGHVRDLSFRIAAPPPEPAPDPEPTL